MRPLIRHLMRPFDKADDETFDKGFNTDIDEANNEAS